MSSSCLCGRSVDRDHFWAAPGTHRPAPSRTLARQSALPPQPAHGAIDASKLPAPCGANKKSFPRRAHAAFSAASDLRGLKGLFQPSSSGSLFYFPQEHGASIRHRDVSPTRGCVRSVVCQGREHAGGIAGRKLLPEASDLEKTRGELHPDVLVQSDSQASE